MTNVSKIQSTSQVYAIRANSEIDEGVLRQLQSMATTVLLARKTSMYNTLVESRSRCVQADVKQFQLFYLQITATAVITQQLRYSQYLLVLQVLRCALGVMRPLRLVPAQLKVWR